MVVSRTLVVEDVFATENDVEEAIRMERQPYVGNTAFVDDYGYERSRIKTYFINNVSIT